MSNSVLANALENLENEALENEWTQGWQQVSGNPNTPENWENNWHQDWHQDS